MSQIRLNDFEEVKNYFLKEFHNKEKLGDACGRALEIGDATFPDGDYNDWGNVFSGLKGLKYISFTNCRFYQIKFFVSRIPTLESISFDNCFSTGVRLLNSNNGNDELLAIRISVTHSLLEELQFECSTKEGSQTTIYCDNTKIGWLNLMISSDHEPLRDKFYYELDLQKVKARKVTIGRGNERAEFTLKASIENLPIMQAFFPDIPLKELTF